MPALARATQVAYPCPMMLLRKTVLNWYRNDVSYSLELIAGFVEGVEKQAADSIVKYEAEKQKHEVREASGTDEEDAATQDWSKHTKGSMMKLGT